jgi:hypothetical protein
MLKVKRAPNIMSINVTDAIEIIKKKISINKISIACLDTQIELSHTQAQLNLLTVKIAREKRKLVEELNALFEKQAITFDPERQNKCMDLYKKLNALDNPTDEYRKLCELIDFNMKKMAEMTRQINTIESSIPQTQVVTNYKMNPQY